MLQYSANSLFYSNIYYIFEYSFSIAISIGLLFALSIISRSDPLKSSFLTTLELPDMTDRCNGVSPSMSL